MKTQRLAVRDTRELANVIDAAERFIEASRSPATRRAYAADWRIFSAWSDTRGLPSLPASPKAVCLFLAAQAEAGLKAATLGRRVAAIRLAHTSAGHEPPTASEAVKTTLRGIRREIGTAKAQKAPATAARIKLMASRCRDDLPKEK